MTEIIGFVKKHSEVYQLHSLLWITFFALKFMVLLFTGEQFLMLDFILSHLLIMVVFYVSVFYLMPCYTKLPFLLYVMLTLLELVIYGSLRYLIKFGLISSLSGFQPEFITRGFIAEVFYLFFQFYIVAVGYRYSLNREIDMRRSEQEKAIQRDLTNELQKEYLQTELAFLKAQINPHFLYNTLSFLYSKAVKVSDLLAESIMSLAEIMRYALSNDIQPDGTVAVRDEIVQVKNLIKIYRLRYDGKFYIKLRVEGESEHRIIPLVIITIVENALKHGDYKDPLHPIDIQISFEQHTLHLRCSNQKKKNKQVEQGSLGLKNILKRLDAHYKENYQYQVSENEETYTVNLIIALKNDLMYNN